jgi:hypothetical protein
MSRPDPSYMIIHIMRACYHRTVKLRQHPILHFTRLICVFMKTVYRSKPCLKNFPTGSLIIEFKVFPFSFASMQSTYEPIFPWVSVRESWNKAVETGATEELKILRRLCKSICRQRSSKTRCYCMS